MAKKSQRNFVLIRLAELVCCMYYDRGKYSYVPTQFPIYIVLLYPTLRTYWNLYRIIRTCRQRHGVKKVCRMRLGMLLRLLVMGWGLMGLIEAGILPGGKDYSNNKFPSVAKDIEEFLRDWTGGQHSNLNKPTRLHDPNIVDTGIVLEKDDFQDRSDDHKHSKSEREKLIRQGIILPVPKHASVEEVYHSEELPRIIQAYNAGDHEVISEAVRDPLELKANNLKFHELLAADVYFSFLTR